ncbi:cytochrome P450 [Saccharomonospora glauca]|jgi:cytochrome P450|uniref:Cytochrome P450 n=1 Tax=Saccharomonospora glauca K62 TaxID=928724 RepID=I1CX11_9PSEU|nr:cytochrome P450 [Saccharomonospora glauca]EIE97235.1 cytochrome P450 [Saccharomonospora glauca K62]
MTHRAGLLDTIRVAGEVFVPTLAGGVLKRRPRVMALADRLRLDSVAIHALHRLRARYGTGPVLLRVPGRRVAVLLDPEDVSRVLTGTPAPFTPATREKRTALGHFQPHAVLATPMPERAPRRRYNEAVLEASRAEHSLADRVRQIVREETRSLPADTSELDWGRFQRTWWRIVRRLVLGDAARDDTGVTDALATLRLRGNWAFLAPKARRRREWFRERLDTYLDRAEPGSLAATIAAHPAEEGVDPHGQVPHWLFAFDAAGMVTLRTLALLATHPDRAAAAEAELNEDDRTRPFLRACVLDTVRLWPTTPVILRESTTATSWRGTQLPPNTLFVVFAPYFHRSRDLVPFADRFAPEAWLDGRAPDFPALVPFSSGPGRCPGENLVLLVTSTLLAELLARGEYRLLAPKTLSSRTHTHERLPATVNDFGLRFALKPHEASLSSS